MRIAVVVFLAIAVFSGCATQPASESSASFQAPSQTPSQTSHPSAPPNSAVEASSPSVSSRARLDKNYVARYEQQAEIMYELLRGEFAGHVGDLSNAVSGYYKAAMLSNNPDLARRATRIAVFADATNAALDASKLWLDLQPKSQEALKYRALLLIRVGEEQKAAVLFDSMIKDENQSISEGLKTVGSLLLQEDDLEPVAKVLKALSEEYEREPMAHLLYAKAAYEIQELTKARIAAEKALRLRPGMLQARVLWARIQIAQGKGDQALSSMDSLLEEQPQNLQLRLTYAKMLVRLKHYQAALAQYKEMLQQAKDDADLLYTASLLAIEVNEYGTAQAYLKHLLALNQKENEAAFYLGRMAESKGQSKQAIAYFNRVKEGEFVGDSNVRIAQLLLELGSLSAARAHLDLQFEQNLSEELSIQYLLAEGQLIRQLADYPEAIMHYDQALLRHPDDIDLLYARALTAEKIDRLDLLEEDLRRILALDEDNSTALNALGYTLADRTERFLEAQELIEKAYALEPEDPAILDSMGWVKYKQGEVDQALPYLRQAFSQLPDEEIASHLAEVLWHAGEKREARQIYDRLLQKSPDNEFVKQLQERIPW